MGGREGLAEDAGFRHTRQGLLCLPSDTLLLDIAKSIITEGVPITTRFIQTMEYLDRV